MGENSEITSKNYLSLLHTPEDFLTILGTCRSRNLAISIILQNLAQLKAKYKEGWENIIGQCDEFLYLGGNESSTHEYISKMLGKETIDTNSYGRRYGMHGDASANFQIAGRELLTPDEVRLLSYDQAILIIKNAAPLVDSKIDIAKYKAAAQTPLGGKKDLEFIYPSRAERLHQLPDEEIAFIKTEQKPNLYEASAAPDTSASTEPLLSFEIRCRNTVLGGEKIAELIAKYTIDYEEIEAFINECHQLEKDDLNETNNETK